MLTLTFPLPLLITCECIESMSSIEGAYYLHSVPPKQYTSPMENLPIPADLEAEEDLELPYVEPVFSELQKVYAEKRKRPPLRREKIARAYQDAFELIGGVPRLALFAHEDPEAFYKLHARLIPTEQKTQFDGRIQIIGFVQPTSLDGTDDIEGSLAEDNP